MPKLRKTQLVYRSAKTGKFVKAAYAKRYPARTVGHRFKRQAGK